VASCSADPSLDLLDHPNTVFVPAPALLALDRPVGRPTRDSITTASSAAATMQLASVRDPTTLVMCRVWTVTGERPVLNDQMN
jgi:hypothetical protein